MLIKVTQEQYIVHFIQTRKEKQFLMKVTYMMYLN